MTEVLVACLLSVMGSDNFREREWATRRLRDVAFEHSLHGALQRAAETRCPEVRTRARRLLEAYLNVLPDGNWPAYGRLPAEALRGHEAWVRHLLADQEANWCGEEITRLLVRRHLEGGTPRPTVVRWLEAARKK